jgi:transposase-like protein
MRRQRDASRARIGLDPQVKDRLYALLRSAQYESVKGLAREFNVAPALIRYYLRKLAEETHPMRQPMRGQNEGMNRGDGLTQEERSRLTMYADGLRQRRRRLEEQADRGDVQAMIILDGEFHVRKPLAESRLSEADRRQLPWYVVASAQSDPTSSTSPSAATCSSDSAPLVESPEPS